MPDFEREEPTGQIDESVDVDSLMESVESQGRGGIPMTHEAQTDAPAADSTPAPDTAAAAAAAQAAEEFEITWNGRQIKAPKDKVLQWASQGYDYPQKMAELKKQREEFDRAYSPYKTVDDYAKQNPEWWKHV